MNLRDGAQGHRYHQIVSQSSFLGQWTPGGGPCPTLGKAQNDSTGELKVLTSPFPALSSQVGMSLTLDKDLEERHNVSVTKQILNLNNVMPP